MTFSFNHLLKKSFICFFLFFSSVCYGDFIEELRLLSRIDLLPRFLENAVVKQISSYDTTGGNDDGFSGKYSYLRKEHGNLVIAELEGPGVIQRIWTPTPTEDTIEFYFDGEQEPRISMKFIDLFTGNNFPFINPIVGNEVGGYYSYIPIPYKESCKIVFKGERMQFFQIQYKEFTNGYQGSSFPTELSVPEKEALQQAGALWGNYGKSLDKYLTRYYRNVQLHEKTVTLRPGEATNLFETNAGGRIVGIELIPLTSLEGEYKNIILKARWDDENVHAINSPVTDFFGYAFGEPSMQSLLAGVRENIHYNYLPMPFDNNATIDLEYLDHNQGTNDEIQFKVRVHYLKDKRKFNEGKLYVKWRREIDPEEGQPYKLLQVTGRGHQVGVLLQAQGLNPGMTAFFEGDDVTVVDGVNVIHGTGSEDIFNGGWYALPDRWDQGYSLPVHGALTYSIPLAQTGGYRFYFPDKVPFNKRLLQTIEHGPEGNQEPVDYTSVAFYYSDTPPAENPAPTRKNIEIYPPDQLEFWTDLLPVQALSFGTGVTRENRVNTKDEKWYNIYKISAGKDGFAKLKLEVPSPGEYRLYISYFKCNSCGTFQVSQRQNPINGFIESSNEENILMEKQQVGTLNIKGGTNTVTLRIKDDLKSGETKDIMVHRLYLERQ